MSTLSVPLTPQLEEMINRLVKSGYANNKATVVRKALQMLDDEQAIAEVLQAQQEVKEGKVFYGDLEEIAKKFRS
jgi:putative addiction module CopG family antidote